MNRYSWPLWLFFVLLPGLNWLLPADWGVENGIIENFQLVFLVLPIGFLWQYSRVKLPEWGGDAKSLCYGGMLFFVLLVGRELSWGRALLADGAGRVPEWSQMGFYGKIAHPLIGVLIAVLLVLLYRARIWSFVVRVWKLLPWPDLLLLLLFIAAQYVAEHLHCALWCGEVAEELSETGAYGVMAWVVWRTLKVFRENF